MAEVGAVSRLFWTWMNGNAYLSSEGKPNDYIAVVRPAIGSGRTDHWSVSAAREYGLTVHTLEAASVLVGGILHRDVPNIPKPAGAR